MNGLRGIHEGEHGYIVGTGRTILNLRSEHFEGGGPIITLNYAIKIVQEVGGIQNKIYSMQKDRYLVQPKDEDVVILLHKHESAKKERHFAEFGSHEVWIFDNGAFGLNAGSLMGGFSQQSAIRMIEWFGCTKVTLYGFDSVTHGNFERHVGKEFDEFENHDFYRTQRRQMKKFKPRIDYKYAVCR